MPDVPGPQTSASSWSTGGLGDSLPQGRSRPRAEVSQQAKDRYAAMERQMKQLELDSLPASRQNPDTTAQPDSGALSTKQGKRPRDTSPQWDASKLRRLLRSSMDVDEQYPDPIDFNAIINPRKKPKCAYLKSHETKVNERLKKACQELEDDRNAFSAQVKAFESEKKSYESTKKSLEQENHAYKQDNKALKTGKEDLEERLRAELESRERSRTCRETYFKECAKIRGESLKGYQGWNVEIETIKAGEEKRKSLESALEGEKALSRSIQVGLDTLKGDYAQLISINQELESRKLVQDLDRLDSEGKARKARERIEGLEKELMKRDKHISSLYEEGKTKESQINSLRLQCSDNEKKFRSASVGASKEKLQLRKALENANEDLRTEVLRVEKLQKETKRQKEQLGEFADSLDDANNQCEELETDLQSAVTQAERLEGENTAKEQRVKELKVLLMGRNAEVQELRKSLDFANARGDQLEAGLGVEKTRVNQLQQAEEEHLKDLQTTAQLLQDKTAYLSRLESVVQDKADIIKQDADTKRRLAERIRDLRRNHGLEMERQVFFTKELSQEKHTVALELEQVNEQLKTIHLHQESLHLELADLKIKLEQQVSARGSLEIRCNRLEEESHTNSRHRKLRDAELVEKTDWATTLEERLANEINRVSMLERKLTDETKQATMLGLCYSDVVDGSPLDILRRLSFPCDEVSMAEPSKPCCLNKAVSVVHGKPSKMLADGRGDLGTAILNAIIRASVQIEQRISTIDLDTILWHIWSTLESYETASRDDRDVVFMPLVHLIQLTSRACLDRWPSEMALWIASQIAFSIFRWKPDGFTITNLLSEAYDSKVLETSLLARLSWDRITSGAWNECSAPFHGVQSHPSFLNYRAIDCFCKGIPVAVHFLKLEHSRELLVVIQYLDGTYILWHDAVIKATNMIRNWRRWLKLDRREVTDRAVYLGLHEDESEENLAWLSAFIQWGAPSLEDDSYLV